MKYRDPIIEELHRVREVIGRAHDFDVQRIAATIRRHEEESREPVIRAAETTNTREEGLVVTRPPNTAADSARDRDRAAADARRSADNQPMVIDRVLDCV